MGNYSLSVFRDTGGKLEEVASFKTSYDGLNGCALEDAINKDGDRIKSIMAEEVARVEDKAPSLSCPKCQEVNCENKGSRQKTLKMSFGEVTVSRHRYLCKSCLDTFYPVDGRFEISEDGWTQRRREMCLVSASEMTYRSSESHIKTRGQQCGKSTIHRHALKEYQGMEEFMEERSRAAKEAMEELAGKQADEQVYEYAAADGVLVRGMDKGKHFEIKVGKVCAVDRKTGRDIKSLYSATAHGAVELARRMESDEAMLGLTFATEKYFAGDGAPWIWSAAEKVMPEAVKILDWFHIRDNVRKVVRKVYPKEPEKRKETYSRIFPALFSGDHVAALAAIEQMDSCDPEAKEEISRLQNYFANNKDKLRNYQEMRDSGLRIGSSPIENAANILVAMRCKKRRQMHWSRRGAAAVVLIRTIRKNGLFQEYMSSNFVAGRKMAASTN